MSQATVEIQAIRQRRHKMGCGHYTAVVVGSTVMAIDKDGVRMTVGGLGYHVTLECPCGYRETLTPSEPFA